MDPLQIVVWRNDLERRLDASMARHHHERSGERRATGAEGRTSVRSRRDRRARQAPVAAGSALAPQS